MILKKLKSGLPIIIAFLMMLCVSPVKVFATVPSAVYVNGINICETPNYTVNCGSGYAIYDAHTNLLTLHNATINQHYDYTGGIYAEGDLHIVLEGENEISGTVNYGIYAKSGDVYLDGTGSLKITAKNAWGIFADQDITITSAITKLQISAQTQAIRSEKNGTITVGESIFNSIDTKVTIEKGMVINQLTTLLINGTEILSMPDYTMQCGNGTAVYDPDSNTLTLNNAEITYDQFAGDNMKAAILFDGDLTIHLIGENKITSATNGILSNYNGTLTITGDKLTINSKYNGIGKIRSDSNITIDHATLQINTEASGNFIAPCIHAGNLLTIKNNANINITANSKNSYGLMGNNGISVSDSTVDIAIKSQDGGYALYTLQSNIRINNSKINIESISTDNSAILALKAVTIQNNSDITIKGNALYGIFTVDGDLSIIDSEYESISDQYNLVSNKNIYLTNSSVSATSKNLYAIYAADSLKISGNSRITAQSAEKYKALLAKNKISISPEQGQYIDIWTGKNKTDAVKTKDSPISAETVLTINDPYFCSMQHIHTFDQEVVSNEYKVSDPTCTEPGVYYKSCICGEKGTETFTSGNPVGHTYKDGKCTICNAVDPNYQIVTNNSQSASTGDNTTITVWIFLMMITSIISSCIFIFLKKNKNNI